MGKKKDEKLSEWLTFQNNVEEGKRRKQAIEEEKLNRRANAEAQSALMREEESAGGDEGLAMNDEGSAISDKGNGGEAAGVAGGGANGAAGGGAAGGGEAAGAGVTAGGVQLPETLPGDMKPNVANVSGTNTISATDTNKTKSESGVTTTQKELDVPLYNKLMAEMKDNMPSAAKVVLELFGDKIDPDKVAAEKADADRRRRRHEGVEAIRLMIEAATGAAHGRIIKRDKANYARYEAEKDKADAAQKAALEKLYAAMAADNNAAAEMKAKIMNMAMKQVTTTGKTSNEQGGSVTKGQTNTASMGHQQKSSTTINTGDNRKDWRTVSIPVQMVNGDGKTYKLTEKVVKLPGGEHSYNSMLNNVASILTEKSSAVSKTGQTSLWDKTKQKFEQSGYNLKEEQMRQVLTNGRYEVENDEGKIQWVDAGVLREQIIISMAGATKRTRAAVTAAGGEWTDLDEKSVIQEPENSVSGDETREYIEDKKKSGEAKSGKKGTTGGLYGK